MTSNQTQKIRTSRIQMSREQRSTKQMTKRVLWVVWAKILKMNEAWRVNLPIYRKNISRIPNDITVGQSWATMCHKKKKPKMSNFVACPKKRDEHGIGVADEEYFNLLHGYSSGMCYSSQISWSFKKHLLTKSKRPDMASAGIRHDQKLTNETKHTELMWQFQCHLWLSYIHTAADNGITLISYKSVKG